MGRTLYALARCKKRRNSGDYADVAAAGPARRLTMAGVGVGDGVGVAEWMDDVLGVTVCVQNTGVNRPVYHASGGIGGLAYVGFDGIQQYFDGMAGDVNLWDWAGWTAGEVFVVVSSGEAPPTDPLKTGLWVAGTHGMNEHFPYTSGHGFLGWGSDTRRDVGSLSFPTGSCSLLNIWSRTGGGGAYLNGVCLLSTGSNNFGLLNSAQLLGRSVDNNVFFYGKMYELVAYGRVLSDVERTKVGRGLMKQYGIA